MKSLLVSSTLFAASAIPNPVCFILQPETIGAIALYHPQLSNAASPEAASSVFVLHAPFYVSETSCPSSYPSRRPKTPSVCRVILSVK